MVIAHTKDQALQEKIKALPEFSVLESAKGLLIHGNADQIRERLGTLANESGAWLGLEIYDGGQRTEVAFNDSYFDCDRHEEVRVPAPEEKTEENKEILPEETVKASVKTESPQMDDEAPLIDEEDDFLSDIDPAAIREELAAHGIVNGEVVDPKALENAPFVKQVMEDVAAIAEAEKAEETAEETPEPVKSTETPASEQASPDQAEPAEADEPAKAEPDSEDDDEPEPEETPDKKDVPKAVKKPMEFGDPKKREVPPMMEVPKTAFTAEEAVAKLESERDLLREEDRDARWVMTDLQQKCREDNDLCQYVMREGKTFLGAYEYFARLARNMEIGIVMEKLGGVSISCEVSTPYFIEYFMMDDDEIARRKKEEEEKKKAERAAKAAASRKKGAKKDAKQSGVKAATDPGLLAGIPIPKTPKAEAPRPAEKPAPKPAAPKAEKASSGEQMDIFGLIGIAG